MSLETEVTRGEMARRATRLAIALVTGGALHVAWVASFILGASVGASGAARVALWAAAPIMTAAGYTAGLTFPVRGATPVRGPFAHVFMILFIACAVGALVGVPIGPMFVGLGVLAAGALSALVLVVVNGRRNTGTRTDGTLAS